MKESLLQYANYNLWANGRMIDSLLKLSPEQLDMDINSSFNTIRKTVLHCLGAEYIWLQRLQLAEQPVWIGDELDKPFDIACTQWQQASKDLLEFINAQFDDKALQHVIQYYRKKQPFKLQVWQVLHHVFNHNTYHRGQLVTMLRQAGVNKIPGTDFSSFFQG